MAKRYLLLGIIIGLVFCFGYFYIAAAAVQNFGIRYSSSNPTDPFSCGTGTTYQLRPDQATNNILGELDYSSSAGDAPAMGIGAPGLGYVPTSYPFTCSLRGPGARYANIGNSDLSPGVICEYGFTNSNDLQVTGSGYYGLAADASAAPGCYSFAFTSVQGNVISSAFWVRIPYIARLSVSQISFTFATGGATSGNGLIGNIGGDSGSSFIVGADIAYSSGASGWLNTNIAPGPYNSGTQQPYTISVNSNAPTAPGTYTATVTITGFRTGATSQVDSSPQPITVTYTVPAVVPAASLTCNGSHTCNVSVGSNVTYNWTSANANTGSTTLQIRNSGGTNVASDPCGATSGPFSPITGTSGTTSGTIISCQAGYSYTFTYTASGPGGSDSDVATVAVAAGGGVTPTPSSSAVGCTVIPSSQNPNTNVTATGTGGNGVYTWTAPGGSPSGGSGPNFNVSYAANGIQTITVRDSVGSQGTCIVNIVPNVGGSSMVVSPTTVTLTAVQNGPLPPGQPISILNNGATTLNITYSANAPWINILPGFSLSAGSVAQRNILANTTNLSVGTHTGIFNVNGQGPFQSVDVIYIITAPPRPTISINPGSFTFNAQAGGANPAGQVMVITNTGSANLNWSLSDNATWLSSSDISGVIAPGLSQSVTLNVSNAGLTAGTRSGSITISDVSATNNPQSIPVTFNLSPPTLNVTLGASPTSGNAPLNSTLLASVTGASGTINYSFWWNCNNTGNSVSSVSTACGALPAPANGTCAGNAVGFKCNGVNANPQLAPNIYSSAGTFTGKVIVESDSSVPDEARVSISVTNTPRATITINGPFNFSGQAGGSNPANQTLVISNTGNAALNWIGSDNASWLSLGANSGTVAVASSQNVNLSVNIAGLSAGTYTGIVTISDPNASNNPRTVTVTLNISAALNVTLTASPASGGTPLSTTLSAAVTGASGTINYSFWWNCNNTGNSVSSVSTACGALPAPANGTCAGNAVGFKCNGVNANPQNVAHTYATSGTFIAKVIAESGSGAPDESRVTVTSLNQSPTVSAVTIIEPDYCTTGPSAFVSWTYTDPEGDPQSAYQVQIDDTATAFAAPLAVDTGKVLGTGRSYFANSLAFNQTYTLRVRVWDVNDQVSPWVVQSLCGGPGCQ